jgi:RNA polymerase primary sigma factor
MGGRSNDIDLLQIYMKQIRNIPILSVEEERGYAERYARGDKEAKEVLIVSNLKYVVSVALKYSKFGVDLMDLISEGNTGLIRAVEKYDLKRNVRFISYAKWWIRHYIISAIIEQPSFVKLPQEYSFKLRDGDGYGHNVDGLSLESMHTPISIDQALDHEEEKGTFVDILEERKYHAPDIAYIESQLKENLKSMMNDFQTREKDIVVRHFGLNGISPVTLNELGRVYDISKERVRQIEKVVLDRLRKSSRKKQVLDYIRS